MCLQWGPLSGFPKEARVSGRWLLPLGTSVLALLWGCQFQGRDSCILDWFVLNATRAWRVLVHSLFSVCHLGTLEGVHGPCLWLGSSLPESLEEREEEPQRAIGAKNGTIVPLGQQELGLMV